MAKHTNNDTSCAQAPRATHCRAALCALATTALLAACGGGGGGGQQTSTPVTSPATTSPTSPVVVNNYELQTTVPAPTYAAGSWQEFVFNYINERRSQCGFGKLAQDTSLDKAAQGHAEYLARLVADVGASAYGLAMHEQVAGLPMFTGKTLYDRIVASGYSGTSIYSDESLAGGKTRSDPGARMDYVRERTQALLSTAYHMFMMMNQTRDIGLGMKNYSLAENPNNDYRDEILVVLSGWKAYRQASKTDVLTYPCEGSKDVSEALYGELPDPSAGQGFSLPSGPAILMTPPLNGELKVQNASVTPISRLDGTPTTNIASFNYGAIYPSGILILDQYTDTYNKVIRNSEGLFLLTHKPLEKGTKYRVVISFALNGVPMQRSFDFSTRAVQ